MPPSENGTIQLKARSTVIGLGRAQVVVRHPHQIEVRRGEPEYAAVPQDPPALSQKVDGVRIRNVLDEMLGKDVVRVPEGQPLRHVEHTVDAGIRLVVDIDPARQDQWAGAELDLDHRSEPITFDSALRATQDS